MHDIRAIRENPEPYVKGWEAKGLPGSRGLIKIEGAGHAASLTLATVSERAGISVSMLSQVERGLLDPSLDTLRNIADALGTAPFRLGAGG